MVDSLGGDWVTFFMITAAVALPGLMMLIWMIRRFPPDEAEAQAAAADMGDPP